MPHLNLLPPQGGVFFDESRHRYWWMAEPPIEVPSSSQIISLSGGKDFNKAPWLLSLLRKGLDATDAEYFMERVRDIRAEIGTIFHGMAAESLGLAAPGAGKSEEASVIHALWLQEVYPRIGRIYIIEKPMIHPGGVFGFTPDLVAEVDGVLTLCDWKTNQAQNLAQRYKFLSDHCQDGKMLSICQALASFDASAGITSKPTARVRDGWQMQQGSYKFGVEAVHGIKVARGINFMLSVDGVKEASWNTADLDQGWLQFARGLFLHHQRAFLSGKGQVFLRALEALAPLMEYGS